MPVLAPAALAAKHPRAMVVIASQYVAEISATLRGRGFGDERMYAYNNATTSSSAVPFKSDALEWRIGDVWRMIYESRRRELSLWADNADDLRVVARWFALLDIPVAHAIQGNNETAAEALLHEPPDSLRVIVVNGRDSALRFIERTGIDYRVFGTMAYPDFNIKAIGMLDPSLGHNKMTGDEDAGGVRVMRTRCADANGQRLKLAVLGNSTSTTFTLTTKSWPQCLVELAERRRLPLEVWCGAVALYTSAQELVKLMRDFIPHRPNIVVSYGGNCEGEGLPEHPFIAQSQRRLCKDAEPSRVCLGWSNDRPQMETWLEHERMMHGVCAEFGIRFHAFLKGDCFGKRDWDAEDRELAINLNGVCDMETLERNHAASRAWFAEVAAKATGFAWFHDASHIWDGQTGWTTDGNHTTAKGAAIVANYIYGIIFSNEK